MDDIARRRRIELDPGLRTPSLMRLSRDDRRGPTTIRRRPVGASHRPGRPRGHLRLAWANRTPAFLGLASRREATFAVDLESTSSAIQDATVEDATGRACEYRGAIFAARQELTPHGGNSYSSDLVARRIRMRCQQHLGSRASCWCEARLPRRKRCSGTTWQSRPPSWRSC
jgi:hypothetical protein